MRNMLQKSLAKFYNGLSHGVQLTQVLLVRISIEVVVVVVWVLVCLLVCLGLLNFSLPASFQIGFSSIVLPLIKTS